jgi:hypothetical protein
VIQRTPRFQTVGQSMPAESFEPASSSLKGESADNAVKSQALRPWINQGRTKERPDGKT